MSSVVPRVYVLGKSPLAGLVTHALAKLPEQPEVPEIVSLLPSEEQLRHFLNHNSTVKLTQYNARQKFMSSSAQLMSACRPPVYNDGSFASITDLVVSLANPNDIKGLKTYKPCIRPYTNILLLNNDKSILNTISTKLWSDPLERPNIYQCVSDFTVWKDNQYDTSVLGGGSLKIAKTPRFFEDPEDYNYNLGEHIDESGDLIKLIYKTGILDPKFLSYKDFAIEQAELMIAKSCIGPLTTLYDCTNGDLLHMKGISQVLLTLIRELTNITNKSDKFLFKRTLPSSTSSIALDPHRLLDLVLELLSKSAYESSVMRKQFSLWDISEFNSTLTYFTQQALKYKVHAPNTIFLSRLLLAKVSMKDLTTLKDTKYKDVEDIELEL